MSEIGCSSTEKWTSINAVEGGFIVQAGGKTVVTTSLNKAIKLVRDYLGSGDEAAE